MIISARAVFNTGRFRCDECDRLLEGGPSVYLYGAADVGDKPGVLRLCLSHFGTAFNPERDQEDGIEKLRLTLARFGGRHA